MKTQTPAPTPRSCWVRPTPAASRCLWRAGSRLPATHRNASTPKLGCASGRSGEGYEISRIDLRTEAEIPGVDEELFLEKAEAAKRDCAVSKALAGVEEIRLEAKLVEHAG